MHVGSRGRGAIQGEQTLQAGQPLQGVRYPGPEELGKDEKLSQRREAGALFSRDHEVTSSMIRAKPVPCPCNLSHSKTVLLWGGLTHLSDLCSECSGTAGARQRSSHPQFNLKPRLRDINGPNDTSLPPSLLTPLSCPEFTLMVTLITLC